MTIIDWSWSAPSYNFSGCYIFSKVHLSASRFLTLLPTISYNFSLVNKNLKNMFCRKTVAFIEKIYYTKKNDMEQG